MSSFYVVKAMLSPPNNYAFTSQYLCFYNSSKSVLFSKATNLTFFQNFCNYSGRYAVLIL